MGDTPSIVLASTSRARTQLLSNAGVVHSCDPANVDEASVKAGWTGRPEALARELARSKALTVSARYPDALVIGADQVLALGGNVLDKPGSKDRVAEQLNRLSGREHRLISAVAVAYGPDVLWDMVDTAHMHMRQFSESFLND